MAEKLPFLSLSLCVITADECLVVLNIHVTAQIMISVKHISSGKVSSLCTVAQDQLQNYIFAPLSAGDLPNSTFIWFQKKQFESCMYKWLLDTCFVGQPPETLRICF
jgi:hypothetical protein